MEGHSVIGKRHPRIDGIVKTTGDAKYCGDLILPGMLHGKILRSPYAHARILHIDTSPLKKLPGVRAVITAKDIPGQRFGRYQDDRPELLDEDPLALEKVRYIGDEVAAVAAVDEDTAEEALDLIRVEYEELPPVFDPEEAMKLEAPKIHETEKNVSLRLYRHFGDVDKAFEEADFIFEDRFKTHGVTHCFLEPHTSLAFFDSSGKLTLWSSTQNPFPIRMQLARGLKLPESNIRVIKPFLGGGFGGKVELLSLDFCSSLLSMKTGKPVKILYTREEVFTATRQRHPMIIELRTGVKRDGKPWAKDCKVIADGGAYNALGPTVMMVNCSMLMALYRIPNIRYEGLLVYTNKPPCSAQRGYGNPQIRFADESQMDLIAKRLGMDPVELRIKNATQRGDVTLSRLTIKSCGYEECLKKASEKSGWERKWNHLSLSKGIGLSGSVMVSGAKTYQKSFASGAVVEAHEDGSLSLFTGASDIGQGSDTVLSLIAAEELGINPQDVRITAADTEITPWDIGTSSGRVTMFAGNAVKLAAMDAKRQILGSVAEALEVNAEDLELKDKKIFVKGSPEKGMSLSQAISLCLEKGRPVLGHGYYDPGTEMPDPKGRGNVSPAYSFSTFVAEIEVDKETGIIKVEKVTAAHDCGLALNPLAAEGQIEGAISMALGYGLTEEFHRKDGQTLNPNFLDHKMLTALDMPAVSTILVESLDPEGPFGAKEAGQGVIVPVAPAIANALENAIGARIKELPLTPETVLSLLS